MLEELQIRCPRLGGEVTFAYCQKEGGDLPCQRIVLCWEPYFPVETYLKARLTEKQWDSFLGRKPKDKIGTLIELIEEAKKAKKDKS